MSVAAETIKNLETVISRFRKNKHENETMKIGKDR
jgi:hypothetical protein